LPSGGPSSPGVDIAANQIAAAAALAAQEGLDIVFHVDAAESLDFPEGSFEVIAAGRSWLYFDAAVMIPKVVRFLTADGGASGIHAGDVARPHQACERIDASLSAAEVEQFDAAHRTLLETIAPETFTVLHQMTIHVYMRKGDDRHRLAVACRATVSSLRFASVSSRA